MRNLGSRLAFILLVLMVMFAMPRVVMAQESGKTVIKTASAPYVAPTAGKEMYVKYCGSCHGAQGKGDGPAAAALKLPPTDLSMLTKNNKGKFPEAHFRESVMRGTVAAHGAADMPVWGQVFSAMDKDPATTTLRMDNLMKYVEMLSYPIK